MKGFMEKEKEKLFSVIFGGTRALDQSTIRYNWEM